MEEEYIIEIKNNFDDFMGDKLKLYNSNGRFIANINTELQLLDVLIQIKRNNLSGYYIVVNDERHLKITKKGRVLGGIDTLYSKMLKEIYLS